MIKIRFNILSVLILLLCVSSHFNGVSQTILTEKETIELNTLLKDIDGTYQIQMIDTRALPQVHISIATKIEEKRHETEYQYFDYNESTRVMILPKDLINSSDFKKIEKIKHISSIK